MDKYIVDTSVWIDFFRGSLKPTVYDHLSIGVLERNAVITDVIRHEILTGTLSKEEFHSLKKALRILDCHRISEEDLSEFDSFGWELNRKGLQGKFTDVSIAFLSYRKGFPLLSFDSYFHRLDQKGLIKTIKL